MILSFDIKGVRKLVDHAKAATQHKATYGQPAQPGLILAGDQGVYLVSSGKPDLKREDGKPGSLVVYAQGINPEVDDFDSWWGAKRASFGPDDGADLLPLESIEPVLRAWEQAGGQHLQLDVTANGIGFFVPTAPKPAKPQRKPAKPSKRKTSR